MKKRILSIMLLCCMVLTLLPTAVFAAETGAMDNIGRSEAAGTSKADTIIFSPAAT